MMVLGTHVFDLMRRFAGDPEWVFARLVEGDRPFRKTDVRMDGPEGMGPIGGTAIDAMYGFAGGRTAFFGTRRSSEIGGTRFGLDLYGSRGVLAIRAAHVPEVWVLPSVNWTGQPWKRLEIPAGTRPRDLEDAYHLMIDDLLDAITKDKEPVAGGRERNVDHRDDDGSLRVAQGRRSGEAAAERARQSAAVDDRSGGP